MESTPFASGGLSLIFKGSYDGHKVAVKHMDLKGQTLKQRKETTDAFMKELDIGIAPEALRLGRVCPGRGLLGNRYTQDAVAGQEHGRDPLGCWQPGCPSGHTTRCDGSAGSGGHRRMLGAGCNVAGECCRRFEIAGFRCGQPACTAAPRCSTAPRVD